jgi:rubredoxin
MTIFRSATPPCMSHTGWEPALSGRGLCSACELVYIATNGRPSPPCPSEADWLTLFKSLRMKELRDANAKKRDVWMPDCAAPGADR